MLIANHGLVVQYLRALYIQVGYIIGYTVHIYCAHMLTQWRLIITGTVNTQLLLHVNFAYVTIRVGMDAF